MINEVLAIIYEPSARLAILTTNKPVRIDDSRRQVESCHEELIYGSVRREIVLTPSVSSEIRQEGSVSRRCAAQ